MDVSIVIVNWNTRDLLKDCLESILAPRRGGDADSSRSSSLLAETIVVDNASEDGSAEMVAARFPEARLIASLENLGWAKGNNVGARAATGRYIFLLNPDTVLKPDSVEILARFMDGHPDAGACAPKLLNPDGTTQRSIRRFPEPSSMVWEILGFGKLFPRSRRFGAYRMTDFDYDRTAEVEQPMGAALFIRREAWGGAGEIDERFPIFFNDVDWCYRAVQEGWKIYFVPDSEIVHLGGSGTGQVKPRMIVESHRSFARYYDKHYRRRLPKPIFAGILGLNRVVEALRLARARRQPAKFAAPRPEGGIVR
jgi:GT2 family glycosyltransferase